MRAVIVSYHTGEVLWRCLDAALAQCDRVVVVDNGNPPEVTARLRADARWETISGHGNIGFAAAVNRGARELPEDHVLVLNPDAVPEPGCVARLVEVADGYPAPAVIGARLVDEAGRELRGSRRKGLTPWTALFGINLHRRPLPDAPVEVGAVSGAAMLLDRESWVRLGGFDDRYFLHVEDLDLCHRARRAGGSVVFVPDADVLHPGGTSDAPALVVETHKLMGFRHYLVTHHPFWGRCAFAAMRPALALRRRLRN